MEEKDMFMNQIFELSMRMGGNRFKEIFSKAEIHEWDEEKQVYIDCSFVDEGISVNYFDYQYKKKVTLTYNLQWKRVNKSTDVDKIVRDLNKFIKEYFGKKYSLQDFKLSAVVLVTDIKMEQKHLVGEYLKVFRRIGKVKNYKVTEVSHLEKSQYFCLSGKCNGIQFMVYNLETVVKEHLGKLHGDEKKIKDTIKDAKDVLRLEVKLGRSKAVNSYTEATATTEVMKELLLERQNIWMMVLKQIVPYGNFYKKDKTMEILHNEVQDKVLRRKMMRLVTLIPEKKSLHLAQKSMSCKRDMDQIMDEFTRINLSPVTLSKRQDVKFLENLYKRLA